MNKKQLKQHNLFLLNQLQSNLGFNPKEVSSFNYTMYNNLLQARDRAICSNRYICEGLDKFTNVTSAQLECLLYDFGSLGFNPVTNTWVRFAKQGKLNSIGQLSEVKPIGLDGSSYDTMWSVLHGNNIKPLANKNVCVILHDYTGIVSTDLIIPRATLNSTTTIRDQVGVYRQLYNTILTSSTKLLARCENVDQARSVLKQAEQLLDPDNPILAVIGGLMNDPNAFELWNRTDLNIQEYITAIDFYDKVRNEGNGFETTPINQKSERMLTDEVQKGSAISAFVLNDGLRQREYFSKLLKMYTGIELKFKINEQGADNDNEHDTAKKGMAKSE